MLSSIPLFRPKVFGWTFLLALALAGASVQPGTKATPPQQIKKLDNKSAAKLLIHIVKPTYPPVAKVNFVRGEVKLGIRVNANGHVAEAHVLEGEPILAVAALNAVRKWLYRPYLSPEGRTPFTTFVTVKFNLHARRFGGRIPKDADSYLERQIRPPKVISSPQRDASPRSVPMKVLVGSKGEVLDAISTEAMEPEVSLARKSLQHWKFRPARWGAIAIPWYILVKVPIDHFPLNEVANSSKR